MLKGDPRCHCVEGYYDCGFCEGITRQRIWNKMSAKDRAYDRYVDPINSSELDRGIGVDLDAVLQGCSCHISPPCSFCCRDGEEE